jgi:hypothetical protein
MNFEFPTYKKYTFETKGRSTVKVLSREYTQQFNSLLYGMVERRMRLAVKTIGSFWYTAWVNAGQPDLSKFDDEDISDSLKKANEAQDRLWKSGKSKGRPDPE